MYKEIQNSTSKAKIINKLYNQTPPVQNHHNIHLMINKQIRTHQLHLITQQISMT